jgi:hypothetical protein
LFTKQPDEIIPISMDFQYLLNNTETISTLSVKTYDESNVDTSSTMVSNAAIDNEICKATIQNGTDGARYKITFKITTDEGNVYEEDVLMKIKAL